MKAHAGKDLAQGALQRRVTVTLLSTDSQASALWVALGLPARRAGSVGAAAGTVIHLEGQSTTGYPFWVSGASNFRCALGGAGGGSE